MNKNKRRTEQVLHKRGNIELEVQRTTLVQGSASPLSTIWDYSLSQSIE